MSITIDSGSAVKIKGKYSLFVTFDYDSKIVSLIKEFPLRYYNPVNRSWELPHEEIHQLLKSLKDNSYKDITINCPKVVKEMPIKLKPIFTKDTRDVRLPKDFEFKTKPYPHQLEAIKYGLINEKWLLGDEMGVGKTKSALDLAVARKIRGEITHCIIICGVNGLKYNWKDEIKIHTNESSYIIGTKLNSKFKMVEGSMEDKIESISQERPEFFLIINIESLRKLKFIKKLSIITKNNMIVFDEFHRSANPTTAQTVGLLKLDAKYKLPMTGTPILNKPLDLYVALKWLNQESASFYQFKYHYCIMGGYGNHQIVGYKNMNELRTKVDRIMLRRLKKDVLDLPQKIRHIEYVEMGKNQAKLYNEILNEIKQNLVEIKLDNNPLSRLIRLRQATGCPEIISKISDCAKLDRMEELVEEIIDNGEKLLIFSQWSKVVDICAKRLKKYKIGVITGDTPLIERQRLNKVFQETNDIQILIGTTGAMGTGLTLTAATHEIFMDIPWTPGTLEQAEDRAHRIGTNQTINIDYLTTKSTIDERIISIVNLKKDISDALIDGKMDKLSSNRNNVDFLLS